MQLDDIGCDPRVTPGPLPKAKMAPRTSWKGFLGLAFISISAKAFTADPEEPKIINLMDALKKSG